MKLFFPYNLFVCVVLKCVQYECMWHHKWLLSFLSDSLQNYLAICLIKLCVSWHFLKTEILIFLFVIIDLFTILYFCTYVYVSQFLFSIKLNVILFENLFRHSFNLFPLPAELNVICVKCINKTGSVSRELNESHHRSVIGIRTFICLKCERIFEIMQNCFFSAICQRHNERI